MDQVPGADGEDLAGCRHGGDVQLAGVQGRVRGQPGDGGQAARVVAVADAFDAMTSDRPYRAGMPAEDAFAEVAITTVDEWQGLGIGTILIRTLAREARGAGITRWRAVFFSSNQLTEKLLQRVGEKVIQRGFGAGAVDTVYELYLPEELEGEG